MTFILIAEKFTMVTGLTINVHYSAGNATIELVCIRLNVFIIICTLLWLLTFLQKFPQGVETHHISAY